MFSKEKKKELIQQIKEHLKPGDMLACPMCKGKEFDVGDGFMVNIIHSGISTTKIEGSLLPSAIVICKQCGFISHHALHILDQKRNS